jgi:hypothetical protein
VCPSPVNGEEPVFARAVLWQIGIANKKIGSSSLRGDNGIH